MELLAALPKHPLHPIAERRQQRFGDADVSAERRLADLESMLAQLKLGEHPFAGAAPGHSAAAGAPIPRDERATGSRRPARSGETVTIAGFALDGNKWDAIYVGRRKSDDPIYAGKVDHGSTKPLDSRPTIPLIPIWGLAPEDRRDRKRSTNPRRIPCHRRYRAGRLSSSRNR